METSPLALVARDCFSLNFISGVNFAQNALTEKGKKRKGKNEGSRAPRLALVAIMWLLSTPSGP